MAGTISNTCSKFLHAEIPSLIHSPLKRTVYKGVRDCAISGFVSGAGICVLHYFPSDPIAYVLGRFMQVAGQVSLVWSLGVATSALLEKSLSDECLGKSAKGAVIIAKYALPLLVGLGVSIAFHIPASAIVLTEAYIGTFAIQYRKEAQQSRMPPAPPVSEPPVNSSVQTSAQALQGPNSGAISYAAPSALRSSTSGAPAILRDSGELRSFTPPDSPPSSASRNPSPPSRSSSDSSPEGWRLPKKPISQENRQVLSSSQTAESLLSDNPFAALAEDTV